MPTPTRRPRRSLLAAFVLLSVIAGGSPVVHARAAATGALAFQAPDRGDGGTTTSAAYQGRNRLWIPALGIDRSVAFFSCSSDAYPGDRVYRWGCAGKNNVYLFGHAASVFKPLHDAYVRGRLRKGMELHHADNDGRVSSYAVVWWKLTTPDKGEFAFAAQPTPSLTLQTCVGSRNQYRLIVRLERVA